MTTNRIMPLTNKQIKQRGTLAVSLLVICLVMIIVIFQTGNSDIWALMVVLSPVFGLYGLLLAFGVFVQQAPKSRAFQKSSRVTQAIVLGWTTEELKNHYLGGSPGTPDIAGCLGIILEVVLLAIPRSPTYHYYLDIQFKVEETGRTQNLRVKVDNDLYSRIRKGSEIEVQYATADPRILLIGPEIPNKSAG